MIRISMLVWAALLPLAAQNEMARQQIRQCYFQRGAQDQVRMAHCSGFYVTPQALQSCLNGFFCAPPPATGALTPPPLTPMGLPPMALPPAGPFPPPAPFTMGRVQLRPPLMPPPGALQRCGGLLPNREAFLQCSANSMASPEQRRIMDCYRSAGGSELQFASCASGAEARGLRRETVRCVETQARRGRSMGSCVATQFVPPDVQRLMQCAEGSRGFNGQMNWVGTAVCMSGSFLTPEQQIVAQCMANTGGEPIAFVGCAGGELTARELDKCMQFGIGGDNGCFGNNNSVVIALRNIENDLRHGPGPNNDLIRAFQTVRNDLANGPGPNNDVVRAVNQIGNGFNQLGQGIQNGVRQIFPGLF